MATYTDINILNDDLELDEAGQPVLIYDRDVIAQDIRHAVRESGLLLQLIAQRSGPHRAITRKKLRQIVESDSRVVPGTSTIAEHFTSTKTVELTITAETEFGRITIGA